MNTLRPPLPAQHAATQTSPLKLRTTSVPTMGRVFRAQEVNQDLLIELEGATIDEDPFTDDHYILDICHQLSPATTENLPSDTAPPLKLTSLELGNESLYCDNRWVPTKIPQLLRSPEPTVSLRGHQGWGRGRGQERGCGSSQAHSDIPNRAGGGTRREVVQRFIPRTSQKETIAGTFLPEAGSEEQYIAKWLNQITHALEVFIPPPPLPEATPSGRAVTRSLTAKLRRIWSLETSRQPIKDSLLLLKPDLVLLESPSRCVFGPQREFSWKNVVSFLELTSTAYSHSASTDTIRNSVTRKAYAIFASQPTRRYLFAMSITRQEFHAHMFDHSGVDHSRPYNIHHYPRMLLCMLAFLRFGQLEHIGHDITVIPQQLSLQHPGTIEVKPIAYEIIRWIFYNFVLRGRGTICWHVRRGRKDYVIKDSWTHESRLNREADILIKIRGVKGVPQLIAAWTVQIGGSDDQTDLRRPFLTSPSNIRIHRRLLMEWVGIPLSEFKTIHELLSILIDILDST